MLCFALKIGVGRFVCILRVASQFNPHYGRFLAFSLWEQALCIKNSAIMKSLNKLVV